VPKGELPAVYLTANHCRLDGCGVESLTNGEKVTLFRAPKGQLRAEAGAPTKRLRGQAHACGTKPPFCLNATHAAAPCRNPHICCKASTRFAARSLHRLTKWRSYCASLPAWLWHEGGSVAFQVELLANACALLARAAPAAWRWRHVVEAAIEWHPGPMPMAWIWKNGSSIYRHLAVNFIAHALQVGRPLGVKARIPRLTTWNQSNSLAAMRACTCPSNRLAADS
jgi:hypothetical protein